MSFYSFFQLNPILCVETACNLSQIASYENSSSLSVLRGIDRIKLFDNHALAYEKLRKTDWSIFSYRYLYDEKMQTVFEIAENVLQLGCSGISHYQYLVDANILQEGGQASKYLIMTSNRILEGLSIIEAVSEIRLLINKSKWSWEDYSILASQLIVLVELMSVYGALGKGARTCARVAWCILPVISAMCTHLHQQRLYWLALPCKSAPKNISHVYVYVYMALIKSVLSILDLHQVKSFNQYINHENIGLYLKDMTFANKVSSVFALAMFFLEKGTHITVLKRSKHTLIGLLLQLDKVPFLTTVFTQNHFKYQKLCTSSYILYEAFLKKDYLIDQSLLFAKFIFSNIITMKSDLSNNWKCNLAFLNSIASVMLYHF